MARLITLLIMLCPGTAADDVWMHFDTAVERVFQLKAKLIGARAAVALASSACRRDRQRAHAVFVRAMEHLKAADPGGAGDGLPVRGYLVRACGQCDPVLAQRLAATSGASIFDTFDDQLRRALVDASMDPERAAGEALRAAPALPWVSDRQRADFARMLLKLRSGTAEIADGAFSDILEVLLDEPAEATASLFALGNYVLTPTPSDGSAVELENVDGGGTAYVFRAERPSISDELVIAYLEGAVTALAVTPPAAQLPASSPDVSRKETASDALQREMLDHLRPFVAKWAVHMRAQFNSAARRLSANELENTEDLPVPPGSKFTISLFQREWTRGRGRAMRDLLIGLPRGTPYGPYETLASFSEAVHALAAGQPVLAAAIAAKMPESTHRTLVHGGLPGRENAFLFYREASRADSAVRPGLLLVSTQLLVPHAPDAAVIAMLEAVEALNESDTARQPSGAIRWGNSGFVQLLASAHFRLAVPMMPLPDLRAAVAVLAPHDPTGVLSLISSLRSERRRAAALVAWAQALLMRPVD